ncbi:MAG: hypothetical protein EPO09_10495 [Aquabacterium sp.]|uniref:DUF6160 family protein n=1 Tax=Aquabacterium sp. TaxID=1872578 RepID=UPI0012208DEC|nr:DUF6160 family protein [Aquabacterium sp.]TAK94123.1 MAG: hypothetical protein EPO09_10495 [Aquabacterium sp.]
MSMLWRPLRVLILQCLVLLAMGCALSMARAEPQPLDDIGMADVSGQDGIGFAVHLEMNSAAISAQDLTSRLMAGFHVDGQTTYAIAWNAGGIIDMFAMTMNLRSRPDGSDYMDIGLPFFIGVSQFGFRAFSVQTDPTAAISRNYGQLLLNGHAAMQGHIYLWAQ